jgi:hypothetical protein
VGADIAEYCRILTVIEQFDRAREEAHALRRRI